MSRRKTSATPNLDQLQPTERSQVLSELIAAHPDLRLEAERIARGLLAEVDADEVANFIEWQLREADLDQLASRAGRVRGGYVHENEAAAEILEELLQPELDDLARRARLGLEDAASQLALGLLQGLASCREGVEAGTVLAYAGPDVTDDLAWSVRRAVVEWKISLPAGSLDGLPDGWRPKG